MIFRFGPVARNVFDGHLERMCPPRAMPIEFINIRQGLVVREAKPPAIEFSAEVTKCPQVVGDAESDTRGTAQVRALQWADRGDLGWNTVKHELIVTKFGEVAGGPQSF